MTTTLTTIARRIAAQQDALRADPPLLANPYTGDPQAAIIYNPSTPHAYLNGIEAGTVQIIGTYRGTAALYALDAGVSLRHYEDGPTLRYTLSSYGDPEPLHGQTTQPSTMTDAHRRYVLDLAADTLGAADGEHITYTRAQALAALAETIRPDVKRRAREYPESAYREAAYRIRSLSARPAIIRHATGPTITEADLDWLARKVARDALKDAKREVTDALAKLG